MMPFERKINADATAFLRSFTERRADGNPAVAEKAITEGSAFTEKEALGRENDRFDR